MSDLLFGTVYRHYYSDYIAEAITPAIIEHTVKTTKQLINPSVIIAEEVIGAYKVWVAYKVWAPELNKVLAYKCGS